MSSVDRNVVDFETNWPHLMEPGYYTREIGYGHCVCGVDVLSNLGKALVLAGALATAAQAALQAGIDLGMELVAKTMQEDAMRTALKGQQSIIAPSRQLILPGSEGWKP